MKKNLFTAALFLAFGASFCGAQEWGPSYIPDIPKAMGSAVQEVCTVIKEVSWSPKQPKVGEAFRVVADLFLDGEITDGRIQEVSVHGSYPDGSEWMELARPVGPTATQWTCTVPGAPCAGSLSFRLEVKDSMGNRTVQLPVRETSWPPANEELFEVLIDWPAEEVVCPCVDLSSVEMALTEEDLVVRMVSEGGIRVADERWFLYGVAADRRDYAKQDQGDELGSASFLIYIPFLFKALLINPEKLFDLSVTEFLAGPGDADTLFLEDRLIMRIPRAQFKAAGDAPFKLIALSLALDARKGFELSALSGGDGSPYVLVYPGVQTLEISN